MRVMFKVPFQFARMLWCVSDQEQPETAPKSILDVQKHAIVILKIQHAIVMAQQRTVIKHLVIVLQKEELMLHVHLLMVAQ